MATEGTVVFIRETQSFKCLSCGAEFEIPKWVFLNPEWYAMQHETLNRFHAAEHDPVTALFEAFREIHPPARERDEWERSTGMPWPLSGILFAAIQGAVQ